MTLGFVLSLSLPIMYGFQIMIYLLLMNHMMESWRFKLYNCSIILMAVRYM